MSHRGSLFECRRFMAMGGRLIGCEMCVPAFLARNGAFQRVGCWETKQQRVQNSFRSQAQQISGCDEEVEIRRNISRILVSTSYISIVVSQPMPRTVCTHAKVLLEIPWFTRHKHFMTTFPIPIPNSKPTEGWGTHFFIPAACKRSL